VKREKWLGISHRTDFCTVQASAGFMGYAASKPTGPIKKNYLHLAVRLYIGRWGR